MISNLKKYKLLVDVLENYGELGESVSKNPFLMIDLAELIKLNQDTKEN